MIISVGHWYHNFEPNPYHCNDKSLQHIVISYPHSFSHFQWYTNMISYTTTSHDITITVSLYDHHIPTVCHDITIILPYCYHHIAILFTWIVMILPSYCLHVPDDHNMVYHHTTHMQHRFTIIWPSYILPYNLL